MFRLLAWNDVDRLRELLDDEEVARHLKRVPYPYSREAALDFVRVLSEQNLELPPMTGLGVAGKSCWAIHRDGQLAGMLGLTPGAGSEQGDFSLGYWLGRAYWGQGLASRAVSLACRWAFEVGARRVSASVFAWNPASVRVLEKNGFQFEGCRRRAILRLGQVCDLLNYGLLPEELRQIT